MFFNKIIRAALKSITFLIALWILEHHCASVFSKASTNTMEPHRTRTLLLILGPNPPILDMIQMASSLNQENLIFQKSIDFIILLISCRVDNLDGRSNKSRDTNTNQQEKEFNFKFKVWLMSSTKKVTCKSQREINYKTANNMHTWAHYIFIKQLMNKTMEYSTQSYYLQ